MSHTRHDTILHMILLIGDLIGACLGAAAAFALRYRLLIGIESTGDAGWLLGIFLMAAFIFNIFLSPVNEFTGRGLFAELTDVFVRQILSTVFVIVILYLAHSASRLSRLVFGYYILGSTVLIWLIRLFLKWYLLNIFRIHDSGTKLLIVADSDRIGKIVETINAANDWQRTVCRSFEADRTAFDEIIEYAVRNEVDEAFISVRNRDGDAKYRAFLSELIGMGIKVDIDINLFELDIPGKKNIDEVGHYAVMTAANNEIPVSRLMIKRMMDIAGGTVGTVIFLIAFVIVGPLIRLDSEGPVLFVQKRVGKNGRIFNFYKFRSMRSDAEEMKQQLLDQNEATGLMFKIEGDPRITRIGRFLRRTSIDELPQFWNVLKGDMSLVGTRPPTVDEYERYEAWHKSRLSMKPGITGLWQVSGRSRITDFNEVVKLDMKYIDNWSIREDIKILLKTVGVVIGRKGAE